jgi:hypothetical protein
MGNISVLRAAASATTKIQRTGLLVQSPSSTNSDKIKIATAVQQIITELSGAMSEKEKINDHYKTDT